MIVMHNDGSRSIYITVDASTYSDLVGLLEEVNHGVSLGNSSHGRLCSVAELVAMLVEDLAVASMRPGSWEGAALRDLLRKHGYMR